MKIARHTASTTTVTLRELSNDELFVVSIFGGAQAKAAIDHELERRAVNAEVGRILNRSQWSRQPAAAAMC